MTDTTHTPAPPTACWAIGYLIDGPEGRGMKLAVTAHDATEEDAMMLSRIIGNLLEQVGAPIKVGFTRLETCSHDLKHDGKFRMWAPKPEGPLQ